MLKVWYLSRQVKILHYNGMPFWGKLTSPASLVSEIHGNRVPQQGWKGQAEWRSKRGARKGMKRLTLFYFHWGSGSSVVVHQQGPLGKHSANHYHCLSPHPPFPWEDPDKYSALSLVKLQSDISICLGSVYTVSSSTRWDSLPFNYDLRIQYSGV